MADGFCTAGFADASIRLIDAVVATTVHAIWSQDGGSKMRGDAKKSTPKGRRLSDLQTTGRITGRNGINVIRDDEEISSDDENLNAPSEDEEEDPYANETADEKRVRLAKQYLAGLEGDADGDDSDDPDHAAIAHRCAVTLPATVASAGAIVRLQAEKGRARAYWEA